MRILIVIGVPYPKSSAVGSRMQKLARGLRAAGAEAFLIGEEGVDSGQSGWHVDAHGIPYSIIARRKAPGAAERVKSLFSSARNNVRRIAAAIHEKQIDAVILYGQAWYGFLRGYSILRGLLRVCGDRGVLCLMDFTEWHGLKREKVLTGAFADQRLVLKRVLPRFDGIIAISTLFEEFARRADVPAIRIPALGEAVTPVPPPPPAGPFVLTYLGSLHDRDLPFTLLEGVRRAVRAGADVQLVIVGAVPERQAGRRAQAAAADDPVLRGRVTFTGWVSAGEVERRLQQATALVLLRDDSRETRACFPTRLPEYLHSGRPVILSAVGDMRLYFEHRRNAWLLPPGDRPQELADALTHLASHPEDARSIGLAGRETALDLFSYLPHSRHLLEFLNGLRQRRGLGRAAAAPPASAPAASEAGR